MDYESLFNVNCVLLCFGSAMCTCTEISQSTRFAQFASKLECGIL
jgi:hypothetical protein